MCIAKQSWFGPAVYALDLRQGAVVETTTHAEATAGLIKGDQWHQYQVDSDQWCGRLLLDVWLEYVEAVTDQPGIIAVLDKPEAVMVIGPYDW